MIASFIATDNNREFQTHVGGGFMLPTVISLFDKSGVMVQPWADVGCDCYIVDIQHPDGCTVFKRNVTACSFNLSYLSIALLELPKPDILFAFPPCDHLAVSGARWYKGKGLRALADSIALFATGVAIS